MKKIAIFIDGKNFYMSWRDNHRQWDIDLARLAEWLKDKVGADELFGAFYYTGVDDAPGSRLNVFLDRLDRTPGFFVRKFPRISKTHRCSGCGAEAVWNVEKAVDTSLVADVVKWAALGAYDVAVVVSGDADMVPAVEAAQTFGKVVHVAAWADGLSAKSRVAAFSLIDLDAGLPQFGTEGVPDAEPAPARPAPTPAEPPAPEFTDEECRFLRELDRATARFQTQGGYVGANYFLTRWQFGGEPKLDTTARGRLLDALVAKGAVATRAVEGGNQALEFVRIPEFLRRGDLKGVPSA